MCNETKTGAELKAWRERLGKDEAWIEGVLRGRIPGLGVGGHADGINRRQAAEGTRSGIYNNADVSHIRAAYRAALEAEEARQAAERGLVEPVCPEGVTVDRTNDTWKVKLNGVHCFSVHGNAYQWSDRFVTARESQHWPPHLVRYAADLSEYRAALHAASDKQRKLDAVKAAEEAHRDAEKAESLARRAYDDAGKVERQAAAALTTARREAGL